MQLPPPSSSAPRTSAQAPLCWTTVFLTTLCCGQVSTAIPIRRRPSHVGLELCFLKVCPQIKISSLETNAPPNEAWATSGVLHCCEPPALGVKLAVALEHSDHHPSLEPGALSSKPADTPPFHFIETSLRSPFHRSGTQVSLLPRVQCSSGQQTETGDRFKITNPKTSQPRPATLLWGPPHRDTGLQYNPLFLATRNF